MSDTLNFQVGNTVQLKSGGPKMSIVQIIGQSTEQNIKKIEHLLKLSKGFKNGDIKCKWFVNDEVKEGYFTPESLTLAE